MFTAALLVARQMRPFAASRVRYVGAVLTAVVLMFLPAAHAHLRAGRVRRIAERGGDPAGVGA